MCMEMVLLFISEEINPSYRMGSENHKDTSQSYSVHVQSTPSTCALDIQDFSPLSLSQGTQISALPREVLRLILRWVVSSQLNMRDLEQFSMVRVVVDCICNNHTCNAVYLYMYNVCHTYLLKVSDRGTCIVISAIYTNVHVCFEFTITCQYYPRYCLLMHAVCHALCVQVCRGFYCLAREPGIWRTACQKYVQYCVPYNLLSETKLLLWSLSLC